jgi:hypothetical protein
MKGGAVDQLAGGRGSLTAGPHLSASGAKKKRGQKRLGRRGGAWASWAGLRTRTHTLGEKPTAWKGWRAEGRREKKKKSGPGKRWAGREERRGMRGLGILFLNPFQIHFSNFQTSLNQETMHSNHDAQALVISNFIEMMFKYF